MALSYKVFPGTPYYSNTALTTQAGTIVNTTAATYVNTTYGTVSVGGNTYYVAYGQMISFWNSSFTGAQIDDAVSKVRNPDTAPTANSTNLVTSGGVKSALEAVYDLETFTTLSGLSTLLDSAFDDMPQKSARKIRVQASVAVTPFLAGAYEGTIYKSIANYNSNAILYHIGVGTPVLCRRNVADGWIFENLLGSTDLTFVMSDPATRTYQPGTPVMYNGAPYIVASTIASGTPASTYESKLDLCNNGIIWELLQYAKLKVGEINSSGLAVTVPNAYRGILFLFDSTSSNCGIYFVSSTNSGSVSTRQVIQSSGITINTSTKNQILLTTPSGAIYKGLFLSVGVGVSW